MAEATYAPIPTMTTKARKTGHASRARRVIAATPIAPPEYPPKGTEGNHRCHLDERAVRR
jgi:hypothetical protein